MKNHCGLPVHSMQPKVKFGLFSYLITNWKFHLEKSKPNYYCRDGDTTRYFFDDTIRLQFLGESFTMSDDTELYQSHFYFQMIKLYFKLQYNTTRLIFKMLLISFTTKNYQMLGLASLPCSLNYFNKNMSFLVDTTSFVL